MVEGAIIDMGHQNWAARALKEIVDQMICSETKRPF